jgi:ABC-2 type transport system permease protein
MKKTAFLIRHELKRQLFSPGVWALATLFMLLMGMIYFLLVEDLCRMPRQQPLSVQFFATFWIPVLFVVPLITMRSIAEERKLGTLEALLSTPLGSARLVIAKFVAAYVLYMVLWVMTLIFPVLLKICAHLNGPALRVLSLEGMLGALSFVGLSGLAYVALGIFTSSFCRSQLSAAMLSFTSLFILLVGGQLLMSWPSIQIDALLPHTPWIDYLRTFRYLEDASRAVLDSRPLVLNFSIMAILLGLSILATEWRSSQKH